MYALVDCNNFYASCERAFDPGLIGKPVVVLSNNDGCVIARSQEAKELGIKMGAVPHLTPAVQQCIQFSSNYTLYGDMSNRVVSTLREFTWALEPYSIDESFILMKDNETFTLLETASQIRSRVWKVTGIPVSVGIGPTKTLAKMANKLAKKSPGRLGVYVINGQDQIYEALMQFPIEDIWGIGRQHAARLKKLGVNTAYDLTELPDDWVRSNMSVVGTRMKKELLGIPALSLELVAPRKKGICTGRSFGKLLERYEEIEEAVANFAARCAEKLRKDNSCARMLQVFLHTNPHRHDLPQYANARTVAMPAPTATTMDLVKYARIALKSIFRSGYKYLKAGVFIHEITPADSRQTVLFDNADTIKQEKAMRVLDLLNKDYGRGTVRLGSMGGEKKYAMRAERLSGRYTTNWNDIIKVRL
ncbi:MAG: Y-family DNA polymerase [Bacteroidetes bacterium]|nr:Y-family DNA polymerase [Bacteroidota bacterium]